MALAIGSTRKVFSQNLFAVILALLPWLPIIAPRKGIACATLPIPIMIFWTQGAAASVCVTHLYGGIVG